MEVNKYEERIDKLSPCFIRKADASNIQKENSLYFKYLKIVPGCLL